MKGGIKGAQLCTCSKGLYKKGGLFQLWFPKEKESSGRISWPCTPYKRNLNLALWGLIPESPSSSSSISHLLLKHHFPVVAESEARCLLTSQKHFLSLSKVWRKHGFLLWPLRDCQMLGDWGNLLLSCFLFSSECPAQSLAPLGGLQGKRE
ncbi:hypothetical protein LEMLEM_LOCUS22624 [Lemmus lemmus]